MVRSRTRPLADDSLYVTTSNAMTACLSASGTAFVTRAFQCEGELTGQSIPGELIRGAAFELQSLISNFKFRAVALRIPPLKLLRWFEKHIRSLLQRMMLIFGISSRETSSCDSWRVVHSTQLGQPVLLPVQSSTERVRFYRELHGMPALPRADPP
jgi:hypothetical protein